MNILIENLQTSVFNNIDINAIKTLSGEITKADLEGKLVNLSYFKAIIDITAIKNYTNYESLFDFLSYFDKDKVIILLNNSEFVNTKEFLSKLVEHGYYNFTKNGAGINYLIDHPNMLRDVEKYLVPNMFQSPTNIINPLNVPSNTLKSEILNEASYQKSNNQIIIGIQNLTQHAGATTLMYLMVKQLRDHYKVQGVEMLNQDYIYFRDPDITQSTSLDDLKTKIKSLHDKEVVIIDLNDIDASMLCNYILYLIEPGIIELHKLFKSNINLAEIMNKGKVVLNRSSLRDEDITNFEYETKLKVFFNLGNLNDRQDKNQKIDELLIKLGFNKQTTSSGIWGLFK